ncbi:hypothetical protein JCM10207_008636 [Rhodosporidiobolus poonsookiae]
MASSPASASLVPALAALVQSTADSLGHDTHSLFDAWAQPFEDDLLKPLYVGMLVPAQREILRRQLRDIEHAAKKVRGGREKGEMARRLISTAGPEHLCSALNLPTSPVISAEMHYEAHKNAFVSTLYASILRIANYVIWEFDTVYAHRRTIRHWLTAVLSAFTPTYLHKLQAFDQRPLENEFHHIAVQLEALARQQQANADGALQLLPQPEAIRAKLNLPDFAPPAPGHTAHLPPMELYPEYASALWAMKERPPTYLFEHARSRSASPAARSLGTVHVGMMRDRMAQRYGFASAADWARRW